MIIRNGRYPIDVSESAGLASGGGPSELIPNDTYASDDKFFTVITGINGELNLRTGADDAVHSLQALPCLTLNLFRRCLDFCLQGVARARI